MQVELKATALYLIGECNQDTYPLQKKKHSLEYLRSIAHLRPRSNTLGAVTRVRSALAFATHQFFREAGFQYIHTPILSGADAEGAGEMFQVGSNLLLICTSRLAWAAVDCHCGDDLKLVTVFIPCIGLLDLVQLSVWLIAGLVCFDGFIDGLLASLMG